MGYIEEAEETYNPTYYLLHYSVIKSDSVTTKLPVVFNGSATARSGLSLNEILACGPTV